MSTHYIFVHGWGMGPEFWNPLTRNFPKEYTHIVDLGFIGSAKKQNNLEIPEEGKQVCITHSLGTVWALKNFSVQIDTLIAINGFYSFSPFSNARTLRTMKLRLQKDPDTQMKEFWIQCGMKAPPDHMSWNIKRLQEGLEWLGTENLKNEANHSRRNIVSLAGQKDSILNSQIMAEHWTGFPLQIHPEGGHSLPVSHPDWCAGQIMEFVREHQLEK